MSAEASASASATEVNNSTTAAAPASFDDHKEAAKPLASASVSSTSTSTSTYHDLYLKPGHILTERHPSLAPLPPQTSDSRDGRGNGNGNGNGKQKQKKNRHKKNVKNSFKRGREQTLSDMKVCKSLMVGEPCAFGKDCKYSHDMKEMLSIREEDIQEVQGGCPRFHQFGNCPYGLSCRVGACHLNLATGENLTKEMNEAYEDSIKNHVSYEIMTKLRKDMYPFVCKRYQKGQKKKRNNDRNAEKEAEKAKAEVEAEAKEAAQDGSLDVGEHKKEEAPKVPDADAAEDPAPAPVDVSPLPKAEEEAKEAEADGSHHVGEHKKEEVHVPKVPDADADAAEDPAPAPVDLSPLPNKIRKLIDFRNKVYVAPLTTVGNLPFRRIMKKYGADITCGEMAVAQSLLQGRNGEWALLKRHKDEDVFGVQIAAGHGDVYERISEVIKNEGIEIDFLDMNLGCPIDLICKTGAGAKMMQRDRSLKEAIDGMGKNLSCPITIKIRTGWDEKKPFAHKLVPKIQRWGMGHVGTVMLHGRSRLQRYSKLADWDYIQKVADAQSDEFEKLPIIGNGDIFSFVDYEEKVLKHKDLSPTAMIGRGALIKPWLPTEIKERRHWDISATERLDILKEFVKFGLEHWGSDTHGVNNTRRFLLEWLSFLYRYVPVGLLEARSIPQEMNQRPPRHMCGRSDLETLMMSEHCEDWIKISEMLLGKVREGFDFQPKHKANSYK